MTARRVGSDRSLTAACLRRKYWRIEPRAAACIGRRRQDEPQVEVCTERQQQQKPGLQLGIQNLCRTMVDMESANLTARNQMQACPYKSRVALCFSRKNPPNNFPRTCLDALPQTMSLCC